MEIILRPLSRRGSDIRVEYDEDDIYILWGKTNFKIKKQLLKI